MKIETFLIKQNNNYGMDIHRQELMKNWLLLPNGEKLIKSNIKHLLN